MGYFSKELQILDRNTVKYMIDQLQEDNDKLRANYDIQQNEIANLRQQHSVDTTMLEKYKALYGKYKALYGELPED